MKSSDLIDSLQLEPHVEGGYFRRIYSHPKTVALVKPENTTAVDDQCPDRFERPLMSSIYYLLTRNRPIGHLHCNRSDILHFFLQGGSLRYTLLWPDGRLQDITLGQNLEQGEQLTLLVPGGVWKASQLIEGEYGLIAEVVSPGFDYQDMTLATRQFIKETFPQHLDILSPLVHERN